MTTFGSVCSGIEAASVAWHPLGWRAAWLAEIEPFPSAVLAHHYPDVPNLGDMTKLAAMIRAGQIDAPDVFCGGTPCQAFSVAGLRLSLDDARGNLSLTFCEIANELDTARSAAGKPPCTIFWENVPGVLNTKDNAFGSFLAGLAGEADALIPEPRQAAGKSSRYWRWDKAASDHACSWPLAGCVVGPTRTVAWRVLDAQYFGVAQRRRRVFVVASARNGFDPAAVLFEFDGVRRDSAPRREAGEGAARCLTAGTGKRFDAETEAFAVTNHTLRGEGFDASEDGAGRGTPLVPVTVGALSCNTGPNGHDAGNFACNQAVDAGHVLPVAFPANLSGTQHASTENLAPAMGAKNPTAVAVALRGREGGATAELGDEVQNCLRASSGGGDKPHVLTAMQVRRLAPRECERLQGFPDDYTAIPWRKKPASECPDGPRYKALGNSWAVPNVRWIGRRIDQELRRLAAANDNQPAADAANAA